MQNKAPFGGRERSEEAWGGLVEGSKKRFPVRIELTTLGLWDPRAANCAKEAGANTLTREGLVSKSMARCVVASSMARCAIMSTILEQRKKE